MSFVCQTTISGIHEKTRPMTIAVTGNAGSGKSTVCDHLRLLGLPVIILDTIAREVVLPGSPALARIVDRFGNTILCDDGTLNRSALRRIILDNDALRRELEQIIHPEIISSMHLRISEAGASGASLVIVEVPLLFELDMMDRFDLILLVTAENHIQIERLSNRDRVSPADARALIKAQMSDEKKKKHSDFVINNDGSYAELINSVDRFYEMVYLKIMNVGKSA